MVVKRIVANITVKSPTDVQKFYSDLFGLEVLMDHGWIVTLGNQQTNNVQVSLAIEGGSGRPVPDLSIEVDDVDAQFELANALGYNIVYPLTDEPWGVRRFFVRDPEGKLLNVLGHAS